MSEQLVLLPGYLTAHLQLTLVALSVGFLASVPLGVAVVRWRGLEPAVLGAASVVQTIPSLALLAIMVPVLAFLGAIASSAFGVETISELAAHAPTLEIAGDYEFFGRPEWRAIRDTYGLEFGRHRPMDSSLMYQAVRESQVDVISAFSTDGRIAAFDLQLLDDDRGVIPPYDAIVLASARLSKSMPQVLRALAQLEGRIDEAAMQQMNLRVDQGGQLPRAVAEKFMEDLVEGKSIRRPSPLRGSTHTEG